MSALVAVLVDQPLLVLFLVLAAGTVLGSLRLAGTTIGPAGALFAGIAASAFIPDLATVVPPVLGTLGLALFVYTVGLAGGPAFVAGVRRGAPAIATTTGVYVLVAVVGWLVGGWIGLSGPDVAGVYAGTGTNSSGLAAAIDAADSTVPAVGYAIAYPFGVLGALVAIPLALRRSRRRPTAEDTHPPQPADYLTCLVARDDLPEITALLRFRGEQLVISRVRRGGSDHTPDPDERLRPGDLVTVIGTADAVRAFAAWVGEPTDEDLVLDRRWLDVRRVVLSNPRLAGVTVGELDLDRFDAVAGFVRRGDVDVVARDDLAVELGDRIRVIAPRDRLAEVVTYLGDSERAVVVADPIGFSVGLALGLLVGLLAVPLPSGTVTLGPAIGPLLVGLVLGYRSRTGRVVWQLPYATNQTLRQLGALVFLGVVGLGAGPDLASAVATTQGLLLSGLALLLTALTCTGLVLGARLLGAGGPRVAGTLAGGQGQPAILAAALDRTGGDDRVALTYALLFPPAIVVKIVAAQVLATL